MAFEPDSDERLLRDATRLSAFRSALAETVRPGDTVIAMAAGLGIPAMLASEAGAGRVYAVVRSVQLELGREISRANGYGDRIIWITRDGLAELPTKANVLVSDQLGCFGFEGGIVERYADARRFLVPDAITIPAALDLLVAPVENQEIHRQMHFWTTPQPADLDFSSALESALNTGYPVSIGADSVLGPTAVTAAIQLGKPVANTIGSRTVSTITRDGVVHGIGGWFSAQLSPSITISSSPLSANPVDQLGVLLPIAEPVAVTPGDRVIIGIRIAIASRLVSWTVEVTDTSGSRKARFSHSTFRAMLMPRDDLHRTAPGFIPRLDPWMEARRAVLNLCDGARSFDAIVGEIEHGHSKLFASRQKAAAFAASVIRRHADSDPQGAWNATPTQGAGKSYRPPVLRDFEGFAEFTPGVEIGDHEIDFGGV